MRKSIFFIILFIIPLSIFSNMASPIRTGDITSEAYSSKDIDILGEQITITLINVSQAKFNIIYTVNSQKKGRQIPLIFDTMTGRFDSKDGFKVWVDSIEILVANIPSTYENSRALQWIDSLDQHLNYPEDDMSNIIGLKYFEVDLLEGIHTIRVEYIATAQIDLSNPVKEYSFNYNLKPARYWHSFGTLDITIDASIVKENIFTNLTPSGEFSGINKWQYSSLPQDEFTIKYTPSISVLAKIAIVIGPEIIALILSLLLVAFHICLIFKYQGKHTKKLIIVGSILIPFICGCIFMFSFSLVDWIIGENASGHHGYLFFIFYLYPIVMPIYCILIKFSFKTLLKYKN